MPIMGSPPPGGDGSSGRDYPLTQSDVDQLMRELARVFNSEDRALLLLRSIRFPPELIPDWGSGGSLNFWSLIFVDLDNGALRVPYRRLIVAARSIYAQNETFASLDQSYQELAAESQTTVPPVQSPINPSTPPDPPQPVLDPRLTCHLVVWTESDEERAALEAWLAKLGLDPQREWSTVGSLSFRLSQPDPRVIDRLMSTRREFPWAVVPPGDPDYVLRFLHVEGPDGRSFRFSDVPSATPIGSVATELVGQYTGKLPGVEAQPTVIDHVGSSGSRRVNPDNTLGNEGITEEGRLRVGFERLAAAVNPLDRRDAIFRVRNQLDEYADTHPGCIAAANSPALPTEYDIEFIEASFGPPESPDGEPTDISVHQISIVLPPDFPVVAPRVRWLSDVFHPNVYPTYESERLRERPYARGLVCLGTLAESYQPSLDFGELCATLADIAGYRNYSIFALADDTVEAATGRPLLRGDYYDEDAAHWAISPRGQERILARGGVPALRTMVSRGSNYRFEIEPDIEMDG
jgi:ubiquitin-protein ligase